MEAKAIQKDIRMPARKLRRVINVVRGKSVIEAIRILKHKILIAISITNIRIRAIESYKSIF